MTELKSETVRMPLGDPADPLADVACTGFVHGDRRTYKHPAYDNCDFCRGTETWRLPPDPHEAFALLRRIYKDKAYRSCCSCCDSNEGCQQTVEEVFDALRPIFEQALRTRSNEKG